ncbi:acetyl-CoA synthetase-like protein [Penicillium riverlandense]|uniref:acetyl-CoA synthetase-like protein n=1 Tax=Penicillium riverlandense TaxID=1903569 RepID=UPI00254693D5|nr:acetyl-CoA synthetase-like protein [Penicillium riverlandense]KAJ5833057.1 acetyl-CoA synthetase-like protein [Penicillium riverlandense]
MLTSTKAIATAGLTAGLAYLNAKLGIADDLNQLYCEWKGNRANDLAGKTGRVSPWYHFQDQVNRMPDDEICIWTSEIQYTWKETYQNACRYAQMLLDYGVRPNELVSAYMINRPELMFLALGAWAIGAAPANINYNLSGAGLVHCLKISHAKFLLVDGERDCVWRVEEVKNKQQDILKMEPISVDHRLASAASLDSTLFLQYTSGSTGYPKSIPFRNRRGSMLIYGGMKTTMGLKPGPRGDKWYVPMPLYHGTGFVIAIACMVNGFTLCLSRKFSVSHFWPEIRESGATAFVYVGEAARYLLTNPATKEDKQHNIRLMWGNGMRPDVWSRFVDRFGIETVVEFFNSSEAMLALENRCCGPYRQFAVGYQGAIRRFLSRNSYTPVKTNIETGELWRDPRTGFARSLPWDVGGEILVRCKTEDDFVGYYLNTEASNKQFERNVFKRGDLYYRTGDALRRTQDGRWFFLDRMGDTYRWMSENVSTAEVAQVLGQFPGVVEATVYGVHVPGYDGRAGCAALLLASELQDDGLDWTAFLHHARSRLPKYAVPVFLRLLSSPSLTGNGKPNKAPLKRQGIDLKEIMADAQAEEKLSDRMLWLPQSLDSSRKHGSQVLNNQKQSYVTYNMGDWDMLEQNQRGERI